jgi:hypothetical protein
VVDGATVVEAAVVVAAAVDVVAAAEVLVVAAVVVVGPASVAGAPLVEVAAVEVTVVAAFVVAGEEEDGDGSVETGADVPAPTTVVTPAATVEAPALTLSSSFLNNGNSATAMTANAATMPTMLKMSGHRGVVAARTNGVGSTPGGGGGRIPQPHSSHFVAPSRTGLEQIGHRIRTDRFP